MMGLIFLDLLHVFVLEDSV